MRKSLLALWAILLVVMTLLSGCIVPLWWGDGGGHGGGHRGGHGYGHGEPRHSGERR